MFCCLSLKESRDLVNLEITWTSLYLFILQIPRDEEGEPLYEDFICPACSEICSFLIQYPSSIWAVGRHSAGKNSLLSELPENNNTQTDSCVLETSSSASIIAENKPMFLSKNWRSALCRCEKCIHNYKLKNISFLVDEEDSIAEYEKIAKQKREEKLQEQEGAELKLFDNLGHVEKIEILNGIADMKDEIRTFMVFTHYMCLLCLCSYFPWLYVLFYVAGIVRLVEADYICRYPPGI